MKPNFALDLTHDGIGLMHRGKGGWVLVGEVNLTDPDLANSLSMIRQRAVDLDKGGLTSKLIIPPSQILFTTMTAPGPDDATREARIREGLVGLTPYSVEDLVFDWYADGDMAHVAVIARETLTEAEGFAAENLMNPVCFTARPKGSFGREANFGPTSCAGEFLRGGTQVERDIQAPPELMGTGVTTSPPKPTDPSPSDPTKDGADARSNDGMAKPGPAGKERSASAPKAPPAPPELAPFPPDFEPEEDPSKDQKATPVAEGGKSPSPVSAPAAPAPKTAASSPPVTSPPATPTAQGAAIRATDHPESRTASDKAGRNKDGSGKAGHKEGNTGSSTDGRNGPAPVSEAAGRQTGPRASAPQKPAETSQSKPGADSAAIPAFSTRRAGHDTSPGSTNQTTETAGIAPRINVIPTAPPAASDAAETPPLRVQEKIHVPVTAPTVDGQDHTPTRRKRASKSGAKAGANGAARKLKDAARKGLAGATGAATGAASAASSLAKATSQSLPGRKATSKSKANGKAAGAPVSASLSRSDQAHSDQAQSDQVDTAIAPPPPSARTGARDSTKRATSEAQERARREADALTIFGARKSQEIGGKPKYLGLFLVLGLLLFMAVLAVWSMFFLSEQNVTLFPDPEDQFESAISTGTAATAPDQIARIPNQFSDEDVASDEALDADGQPATDSALAEADQGELRETLSPEAAETRYAATGIWERAPDPLRDPSGGQIEGLYVASIDPVTSAHDAVALPLAQLEGAATLPANRLPPPPQGTRFDLDARGLVRATPDGALTPEGIVVYAGRPALVPAPRPGGATPEPEVETAELTPARPTLPNTRPRLRPEGLIERNERSLLGGRTRNELATLRPAPRPESPQALEQANAIAQAIADAEERASQASTAAAAFAPTNLAVARSPEPKSRPRNFDKLVSAARAARNASDGSVVVAAAPRNQTVTPSIPTRASVAKQATMKNAIPLRKVALIGISGSASNRRALVRLKSGRYVKVSVGDRLDGGRVVSISAKQLVYKKGSRSTTLKILPFG